MNFNAARTLNAARPESAEFTTGILVRVMIYIVTFAAFCLFLFPAEAWAQGETTSAIVGQVTDASRAGIPDAIVTITSRESDARRSARLTKRARSIFHS